MGYIRRFRIYFRKWFRYRNKNMLQAVSEPFKQNYYITSNLYNDRNNIAEPYLQVGFCYSISKGNWLFSPRIAAGITTINMSRILLELKGIGNNQMEEVQYLIKPGTYTPSRDMGYISPGIDICYRIGKIYLTLDINYQLFPGKYPIWYGRTNRYTNQLIEEKMFSNNHISGRLMGQNRFWNTSKMAIKGICTLKSVDAFYKFLYILLYLISFKRIIILEYSLSSGISIPSSIKYLPLTIFPCCCNLVFI